MMFSGEETFDFRIFVWEWFVLLSLKRFVGVSLPLIERGVIEVVECWYCGDLEYNWGERECSCGVRGLKGGIALLWSEFDEYVLISFYE